MIYFILFIAIKLNLYTELKIEQNNIFNEVQNQMSDNMKL
jgi:hypothetical protein